VCHSLVGDNSLLEQLSNQKRTFLLDVNDKPQLHLTEQTCKAHALWLPDDQEMSSVEQ